MRKNERRSLAVTCQTGFIVLTKRMFRGMFLLISLFFALQSVAAQESAKISGVVKDDTGQPLIGASIVVKGTTNGTITDLDGKYSIESKSRTGVLVVSYIGMDKVEVSFTGSGIKNIQLTSAATALNEVVAIGYGTVKKRDLTGAVTSVKAQDITARPGTNPMESLQGRVAGLDITKTSGQPGSGVNMQLRGNRSFTADGKPLFLIDGLPGDYETLNPNDIESIEVLKDASSTAVYGSQGANGVIIITTKSAKQGKTKVELNAYYGYNGWSTTPKMRSGESYLQTIRDAGSYVWDATNSVWTTTGASWHSAADDATVMGASKYNMHLAGNYIDWAKELMQTGLTQNYSLSVSGGTEKTNAYLSLNYMDEVGQYKNDNYKVYSTNARIDHKLASWLKIGANLQGSYVIKNNAYAKLENALAADPIGKVYNDDGSYKVQPVDGANLYNLLLNEQDGVYVDLDNNLKLNFNPFIEISPIKGLSILSRFGTRFNYSKNGYFQGVGSYQYYMAAGPTASGATDDVLAELTQNRNYGYNWENIITYNFKIARDHDFTLTGATSWSDFQTENSWTQQLHIENNKYTWNNMQASNAKTKTITSYNMRKTMGYVGRLNYSYLGKYLFSASVRQDGSSVLYRTNHWDTFPAFSLGWRISDESFMESTKSWLTNLKLRGGWGSSGTASIDPYSSQSAAYETGNMSLGGVVQPIYRTPKTVTNPNLGWEKSYSSNFGLDAGFFKNRIELTVDYYDTDTKGVIWGTNLPVIYGAYNANTYFVSNLNVCETNNKGLEIALTTRNIDTRDFKWTSSITFSNNKEKIVKLNDGVSNNIPKTGSDFNFTIGQPVNSYYNFKLDGVWQTGDVKDAAVFGAKPGDLKINIPGMTRIAEGVFTKMVNGVQKYYYTDQAAAIAATGDQTLPVASNSTKYTPGAADYQVLGHNSPDWSFGFQNSVTYKGFDLSVYMYARWGQMIKYAMLGRFDPKGVGNFPEYFDYWTPTNPSNYFPAVDASRGITNFIGNSGLQYVDGSFFKIKNITLGYSLPANLLRKVSIEKFRVYGTITNPLILANSPLIKNYDPEMNGSIDYPLTRQLVFGVNLTF